MKLVFKVALTLVYYGVSLDRKSVLQCTDAQEVGCRRQFQNARTKGLSESSIPSDAMLLDQSA